jgi:hypothetical protein
MGISLHWDSAGQPKVGSSTGDFDRWLKELWMWSVFLCGSSVKGTLRAGSLVGDPEGYIEKALETGISFRRDTVWRTWRRARLPGTLRGGRRGLSGWSISLWKGSVEGASEETSFTGDPGRHIREDSGCGHLPSWGLEKILACVGGFIYRGLW